jgi:hypothetical protein
MILFHCVGRISQAFPPRIILVHLEYFSKEARVQSLTKGTMHQTGRMVTKRVARTRGTDKERKKSRTLNVDRRHSSLRMPVRSLKVWYDKNLLYAAVAESFWSAFSSTPAVTLVSLAEESG